ncbi:MAG: hypothetical protein IKT92_04885 [Bacteroidaceae bacterium]|jgi:hypothetical protein|nr:hypothetical protein [Bacteroidaceae bacterium]
MKKVYIAPCVRTATLNLEGVVAASVVGGPTITPGDTEYDGEFQTLKKGWSSDNWATK